MADMIVKQPTLVLATVILLAASIGDVRSAEPAWPQAKYEYVVVDQDLRDVLTQFGTNTGLRLVLSDMVQGRVRKGFPAAPPKEFLSSLLQTYGLDWYFDGAVIAVSAASEATTRVLPLGNASFTKLRDGLASAGLSDPRFALRAGATPDLAIVSGPPRFVAMVEQVATALGSQKEPPRERPAARSVSVSVFRGSSESRVLFP